MGRKADAQYEVIVEHVADPYAAAHIAAAFDLILRAGDKWRVDRAGTAPIKTGSAQDGTATP